LDSHFFFVLVGATLNANISNSAPGDYYVQVIFTKFYRACIHFLRRSLQKIRHAELFRSNSVKIKSQNNFTHLGTTDSHPIQHAKAPLVPAGCSVILRGSVWK